MADGTSGGGNGGRIVPIVEELPRRTSPRQKRHNVFEEPEYLEIPCLNDMGLYALPTEGDGKFPALSLSLSRPFPPRSLHDLYHRHYHII